MGGHRLRIVLAALALGGGFQAIGAERAAFGSVARTEQEGGIFRVSLNAASGIDYLDPALASSPPGWALLDTTCARLLAYPDKAPPAGFRLEPEVAIGMPFCLERRQDVHLQAPQRIPFQRRVSCPRKRVRPGDQPRTRAGYEIARGSVHARHRRRGACACGEGP